MAPNFFDDSARSEFVKNIYILLFGLIAMAYVGVNRLSIVPCICAFFNALAGVVGWYVYTPGPGGKSHSSPAGSFFAYFAYCGNEVALVMYGYFLLEKLLPAVGSGALLSRRVFLFTFWPLQIINVGLRVSAIITATVSQARTGSDGAIELFFICQAMFLVVTTIEIFTAYLLIVLFRRSRKTSIRFLGGKRLGLFRHMLLSTEIRVASIGLICITRAGCELLKRNKANMNAVRIDATMVDMMTMYPMLLIADCILRKAIGIEVNLQNRTEKCDCPGCPEPPDPAQLFVGTHQPVVATPAKRPSYATDSLERFESA